MLITATLHCKRLAGQEGARADARSANAGSGKPFKSALDHPHIPGRGGPQVLTSVSPGLRELHVYATDSHGGSALERMSVKRGP